MKLGDLKTFDIVTLRNGMQGIIFRNAVPAIQFLPTTEDYMLLGKYFPESLTIYTEDMNYPCDDDFDIMKVDAPEDVAAFIRNNMNGSTYTVWERGAL